jgi:hypothetical protein
MSPINRILKSSLREKVALKMLPPEDGVAGLIPGCRGNWCLGGAAR